MWVEVDGEQYSMELVASGTRYEVYLPHSPPDSEYTIALEREDEEDAYSTAMLPPPFSFGGAPETASRQEGVELDLELPVDWDISSILELWVCGEFVFFGDADWQFDRTENRLWVGPGTLQHPAEMEGLPLECSVIVSVTLPMDGQLDPAFLGGRIQGTQSRSVVFASVP